MYEPTVVRSFLKDPMVNELKKNNNCYFTNALNKYSYPIFLFQLPNVYNSDIVALMLGLVTTQISVTMVLLHVIQRTKESTEHSSLQ